MPLGPYGQDLYGVGEEAYPYALRSFSVRPGMQGPQVVLTWGQPSLPIAALEIRRKLGEYPRDMEDGTLVVREEGDPSSLSSFVDVSSTLLPDAEPGESQWWYYRAFTLPKAGALSSQFGDAAYKKFVFSGFGSRPTTDAIPTLGKMPLAYHVQNDGGGIAGLQIQTAPTSGGPWITVNSFGVGAGATARVEVASCLEYVRLRWAAGTGTLYAWMVVHNPPTWGTGQEMCAPALVFKTGKHMRAAIEGGHLPHVYLDYDVINATSVQESEGEDGEIFNFGEDGQARGHLWKFLCIMLAEFDRVDAYLRAVTQYAPDIDNMPEMLFAHVAHQLGYPLEQGERALDDLRAELFRVAGVWKAKGTSTLVLAACRQVFGLVPRVQEGAGRVFRVADPDLYGRVYDSNDSIGD